MSMAADVNDSHREVSVVKQQAERARSYATGE
jgi:hypothetical protein